MIPKFRFVETAKKKMHEVLSVHLMTSMVEVVGGKYFLIPQDGILMQSTGLFDKSGVEIFEGDVVICHDEQDEYGPYPCQVFFCDDELAWSLKELPTEDKYTMSENDWDEIEVLGNIYENPELVEVE